MDLTAQPWVEGASAEPPHVGPSEESELKKDATDVVIVAGPELVVCEGKFFNGFNTKDLNERLCSQRRQMRHFILNRPSIRACRHVAILPSLPTTAIDADVVLTWADERYPTEPEGIPYFEGTLRSKRCGRSARIWGTKSRLGTWGARLPCLWRPRLDLTDGRCITSRRSSLLAYPRAACRRRASPTGSTAQSAPILHPLHRSSISDDHGCSGFNSSPSTSVAPLASTRFGTDTKGWCQ